MELKRLMSRSRRFLGITSLFFSIFCFLFFCFLLFSVRIRQQPGGLGGSCNFLDFGGYRLIASEKRRLRLEELREASYIPGSCSLPGCFAPGMSAPRNMPRDQTPQMIMLTFDDQIADDYFREVFDKLFPIGRPRRNPNGCPITATFYVSHKATNYDLVRRLYDQGHEIASHTLHHYSPNTYLTQASYEIWRDEFQGQRENLVNRASIPLEHIRGMRAPFLQIGGDNEFSMIWDFGFEYEATFMVSPTEDGGAWPFTLDIAPTHNFCGVIQNCPHLRYPGIWELPVNVWNDPKSDVEHLSLLHIWDNFNRFYSGNRAPFEVHLHASQFLKNTTNIQGLVSFVDSVLDKGDVYFVTAHQVLEWMRDSQTIGEVRNFKPWKTSCSCESKFFFCRPTSPFLYNIFKHFSFCL